MVIVTVRCWSKKILYQHNKNTLPVVFCCFNTTNQISEVKGVILFWQLNKNVFEFLLTKNFH